MVGLTMTCFSEKMLISTRCIHGFMSNLIKKSWMASIPESFQSHSRVIPESFQSHSRVNPESFDSHSIVIVESLQSHSIFLVESLQSIPKTFNLIMSGNLIHWLIQIFIYFLKRLIIHHLSRYVLLFVHANQVSSISDWNLHNRHTYKTSFFPVFPSLFSIF